MQQTHLCWKSGSNSMPWRGLWGGMTLAAHIVVVRQVGAQAKAPVRRYPKTNGCQP